MGKRKEKKSNAPNKKRFVPFIFIGVIAAILATVYHVTKPTQVSAPVAQATGQLLETRPVLSSALFVGKQARAYKYAAEIPKVLDSLFCYCYCKKDHGHKTLLTCFTNKHGSKCGICMNEVFYAHKLYQQGKTMDEIVIAIDDRFYRPYRPHQML